MLERINKRGREYEQLSFDPTLYDYYQELNLRYDQWYEEYQESPKIQIDGDQFNFVEDPEAAQKVLAMVDEALAKCANKATAGVQPIKVGIPAVFFYNRRKRTCNVWRETSGKNDFTMAVMNGFKWINKTVAVLRVYKDSTS